METNKNYRVNTASTQGSFRNYNKTNAKNTFMYGFTCSHSMILSSLYPPKKNNNNKVYIDKLKRTQNYKLVNVHLRVGSCANNLIMMY